ncbi:MAG TPA: hypothetical protein VHD62_09785 [Opitutaceae bacterium]|nr:hypothetical protein [Opitutaceae bacterium]
MTRRVFRSVGACVFGLVFFSLSAATQAANSGSVDNAKDGEWNFNLLPKAFQREPELNMTVVTELTPYGRLLRPPTQENPTYYVSFAAGFKQFGAVVGGEHAPVPAQLEQAMTNALATNGYVAAAPPAKNPTLAVIYYWGSHNAPDRDEARNFPELAAKYRLERALLVGGKNYFAQAANVEEWGETVFDRQQGNYEYLRDQAADDIYFVVASAYDYAALGHGERKLVWRTNMTVSARGISMKESLPTLIVTAAPYLGRDMPEAQIVNHKIKRWGVNVGTPTVIESDVRIPAAAPAAPKSAAPAQNPR